MKTLRITLFTAIVAAFFAGCAGPEGPEGPQGLQGQQGPAGTSAVTGANESSTCVPGDWSADTVSSTVYLVAGFNVPIITYSVVDSGAGVVMVYFQSSSGSWAPLPFSGPVRSTSSVVQTTTFSYDYNTVSNVGQLLLQIQNSNNTLPAAPATFNFNVVVIPTSVIKKHPGFNFNDYNMVKQLLSTAKNQ
ncbi:MAG: hypothetical protein ACLQQ4_14350 [Bacteroidia bacterium]